MSTASASPTLARSTATDPTCGAGCRRSVVMLVAVAALAGVLVWCGRGTLDIPIDSATEIRRWVEATEPALLAAAVLRLAGLAACAYVGSVLVAAVLADVLRWRRLTAVSLRLAPALLRHSAMGGASLGLAAGTLLTPAPAKASSAPGVALAADVVPVASDDTAVMTKLEEDAPQDHAAQDASMINLDPATPPEAPPAPSTDTWVVMPGESFWSIAEQVLTESQARPSESDIAAYWQRLILANRDRLADPGNPDLLFSGQELTIPGQV